MDLVQKPSDSECIILLLLLYINTEEYANLGLCEMLVSTPEGKMQR
jgi:hypothetical protein